MLGLFLPFSVSVWLCIVCLSLVLGGVSGSFFLVELVGFIMWVYIPAFYGCT